MQTKVENKNKWGFLEQFIILFPPIGKNSRKIRAKEEFGQKSDEVPRENFFARFFGQKITAHLKNLRPYAYAGDGEEYSAADLCGQL